MKKILMGLILVIATHAMAHQVELTGDIRLCAGEVKEVSFERGYIEQVFVQARGAGYDSAMFEVWANGKPKGTIYVPGRDPSYIVTIREEVSSLEFRQISGGDVQIYSVKAEMKHERSHSGLAGLGYNPTLAGELARKTIEIVNDLKPSANYGQLGLYILPIRKTAAELYAISAARSPYSEKTREALVKLKRQIDSAKAYIDSNLETDSNFDLGVQLMTIDEKIEAML